MKKIYILDTNIPLLDPDCIFKFEDNIVVIPTTVLNELDKIKTHIDEIGKNSRTFLKILDNTIKDTYNTETGIDLNNDGKLLIEPENEVFFKKINDVFNDNSNDNKILSVALKYHEEFEKQKELPEEKHKEIKKVILVTKDNNLKIKAKYFGIEVQNYKNDTINTDYLYNGWRILPVPAEVIADYYTQKGTSEIEDFIFEPTCDWDYLDIEFYPNEYVILVDQDSWKNTKEELEQLIEDIDTPILRYDIQKSSLVGLKSYRNLLSSYKIYPKNLQQLMVVDLMFNKNIPLKSIIGIAGSGKTLFALLCSIIMVNDLNLYDEIIITRPTVPMEYEIGFLPGNEQKKLDPYLRGFKNNLEYILTKNKKRGSLIGNDDTYVFSLFKIKTQAMTFMRGQTISRKILIIDESQNTTSKAMKTALTRIGEDSIVILLGDISQIDHHLLDATNNGLSKMIELMKDEEISGHVTLTKGERSILSEIIANKWDKKN